MVVNCSTGAMGDTMGVCAQYKYQSVHPFDEIDQLFKKFVRPAESARYPPGLARHKDIGLALCLSHVVTHHDADAKKSRFLFSCCAQTATKMSDCGSG